MNTGCSQVCDAPEESDSGGGREMMLLRRCPVPSPWLLDHGSSRSEELERPWGLPWTPGDRPGKELTSQERDSGNVLVLGSWSDYLRERLEQR